MFAKVLRNLHISWPDHYSISFKNKGIVQHLSWHNCCAAQALELYEETHYSDGLPDYEAAQTVAPGAEARVYHSRGSRLVRAPAEHGKTEARHSLARPSLTKD